MQPSQIIKKFENGLESSISHFQEELKKLRTGRAHSGMLDGITVEAYGTEMPLIQTGSVTAPEAQLLQITPFDPNNLEAITAAIRDDQSLGMNPMDDGRVVRVPIPPLTEERRRDIVKILGQKVEDAMISMRNVRHDALKELDEAKKDKEISEDEHKRYANQIEEAMSKTKSNVEEIAKAKESEIMTV
jgi:ribosome recycling factor